MRCFNPLLGRALRVGACLALCLAAPLALLWPEVNPGVDAEPLMIAAQSGDAAGIERALGSGIDVNICDEAGITPLMAAARAGHVGAVRQLVHAGARVDACAPAIGTPITFATLNNHHDALRELIALGADVDARTPAGVTALRWARVLEARNRSGCSARRAPATAPGPAPGHRFPTAG